METVERIGHGVVSFFTKEDTGHLVTASILSLSILMTIAILSQGSTSSVFQHGFGIWGQQEAKERNEAEEHERDEAEREIFQVPIERIQADEHIGADLFLATKIPWITLTMLVVVLAGGVHVAVTSNSFTVKQ